MRAFIAIEIPEAITQGMAAVQDRLKSAGVEASWTRPGGIHLTLKFLGEVSEERVQESLQALSVALRDTEGFRLGVEGVGTFPNPANARVVWFGITGEVGRLAGLQAAVEQAMADLGMERDDRPFTPHLTLGRVKLIRRRDAWLQGLQGVKGSRLPGFDVTAVSLVRSELKPTGPIYRELGSVALKREPAESLEPF
jgi:RNA 2',3'-cyclic 3'-phosphodiesterase